MVTGTNVFRFFVANQWFSDDSYRITVHDGHPTLGDVIIVDCDFGNKNDLYVTLELRDFSAALFDNESLPDQPYPFGSFDEITGVGIDIQATQFLNFDGDNLFGDRYVLGDINNDNAVNLLDVQPFINLNSQYDPAGDMNCDGVVNLLDIVPFVEALTGG